MGVSSVGDVEEEEIRESSAALLKTRTEGGGVERPGRANGCFPPKHRLSAATPPTQAHTAADVQSAGIRRRSRAVDTLPWPLRNVLTSRDCTATMTG